MRTWASRSSSSWHGKHLVDDVLADLQVLARGDVGVRAEIDAWRDALGHVDVGAEQPFSLGENDQGQPGRRGLRGISGFRVAFPRQGAPFEHDLRKPLAPVALRAGRWERRQDLVGRHDVARCVDVQPELRAVDRDVAVGPGRWRGAHRAGTGRRVVTGRQRRPRRRVDLEESGRRHGVDFLFLGLAFFAAAFLEVAFFAIDCLMAFLGAAFFGMAFFGGGLLGHGLLRRRRPSSGTAFFRDGFLRWRLLRDGLLRWQPLGTPGPGPPPGAGTGVGVGVRRRGCRRFGRDVANLALTGAADERLADCRLDPVRGEQRGECLDAVG